MTEEQGDLFVREWLKKHDIADKDIEEILTQQGVTIPDVHFKTFTQEQWDELYRLATVERFKELKDQQSRNRLQKKCDKLEKLWREISGNEKTVGTAPLGKKDQPTKSSQTHEEALKKGPELKKWMQSQQIWEVDLFEELVAVGVTSEDTLTKVDTQDAFDEIIRKVKVARVSDLKDQKSRNRLEKILTNFEKIWREKTGIEKSLKTKQTDKKESTKAPKTKEIEKISEGKDLKQWMQKNEIWEKQLFDELVKNNIKCDTDLKKIDTQDAFDEIVRKVRVERFTTLKDQSSRNRLDSKLTKFEKLWREITGIKKSMLKKSHD